MTTIITRMTTIITKLITQMIMTKMMKTIPSIVIMEMKLMTGSLTKSITRRTIVETGQMKLHTRHTILVTGDTKEFH